MQRASYVRRARPLLLPLLLLPLLLVFGLGGVGGAGCASNRAPVFERSRALGGSVLLLEPDLQLGRAKAVDQAVLADRLMGELRRALADAGLEVTPGTESPRFDALRAVLVDVAHRARSQRLGRLRPGMLLELGDGAAAASDSGASTVVLSLLGRSGVWYDEDSYVPRPPGEVIPLPQDKPDFYVPDAKTNPMPAGVDLELLAVGVEDGAVIAHRRVSYPGQTTSEIADALPRLVREAVRNLTP